MQNTIEIAASARVWVYMADRTLSEEEVQIAQRKVAEFTAQWAAHGKQLMASGSVQYNRFVILLVDESQANASGCSIDSSVHFMQTLGRLLNIDFFNRLLMAYQSDEGEIKTIPQSKLEEAFRDGLISEETIVFNNLVADKSSLDSNWKVALKDSFYKRLI